DGSPSRLLAILPDTARIQSTGSGGDPHRYPLGLSAVLEHLPAQSPRVVAPTYRGVLRQSPHSAVRGRPLAASARGAFDLATGASLPRDLVRDEDRRDRAALPQSFRGSAPRRVRRS